MSDLTLRAWQREALERWVAAQYRGIVEVVTGGGKTVFALACIRRLQPATTLVVVPTVALLEQWWEEASSFLGLGLDEIHIITGRQRMRTGTLNIAVINTAAKLSDEGRSAPCFLIVDECHRAAAPQFQSVLAIKKLASLGLSATPERPYDEGLQQILIPQLGEIIYSYTYRDALRENVIVPFELRNIVFELEPERQAEYDKLTRAIATAIRKYGAESEETIPLLLRRARVANLSLARLELTLKIVARQRGRRVLIFHEDIEACNVLVNLLRELGHRSGVYHSRMSMRARAEMLVAFRRGELDVLVTCRALDEGFNVPEAEIGIVAASTATERQRIQRLGRILRPSKRKDRAVVYSLASTTAEVTRLKDEETKLEGVASIAWERA